MTASQVLGHGYDTADYYAVDPRLGGMEALRHVVEAAHELGLKVILDGVFNHTGRGHFACREVLAKGRASQYWDWYFAKEKADGRGLYSSPFPLNLSLLCPFPLNLSSLCPPYDPK